MPRLGTPITVPPPTPRVRPQEFIYAVLDAARSPEVLARLKQLSGGWACLYRGESADSLGEVAPYLVQLDPRGEAIQWVIQSGIGNSWGILIISQAPFEKLHHHFRKFLLVQDEEGRKLYFRFYDPRVLRVFLPTCTPEEAKEFFGPISRFIVEETEDRACAFLLHSSGIRQEKPGIAKRDLGAYLALLVSGRPAGATGGRL
jgi:hypothetical protein